MLAVSFGSGGVPLPSAAGLAAAGLAAGFSATAASAGFSVTAGLAGFSATAGFAAPRFAGASGGQNVRHAHAFAARRDFAARGAAGAGAGASSAAGSGADFGAGFDDSAGAFSAAGGGAAPWAFSARAAARTSSTDIFLGHGYPNPAAQMGGTQVVTETQFIANPCPVAAAL